MRPNMIDDMSKEMNAWDNDDNNNNAIYIRGSLISYKKACLHL